MQTQNIQQPRLDYNILISSKTAWKICIKITRDVYLSSTEVIFFAGQTNMGARDILYIPIF